MNCVSLKLSSAMNRFYCRVISVVRGEKGQTLVEYGLLLVLIAVVVMGAVAVVGVKANVLYVNASNKLP